MYQNIVGNRREVIIAVKYRQLKDVILLHNYYVVLFVILCVLRVQNNGTQGTKVILRTQRDIRALIDKTDGLLVNILPPL